MHTVCLPTHTYIKGSIAYVSQTLSERQVVSFTTVTSGEQSKDRWVNPLGRWGGPSLIKGDKGKLLWSVEADADVVGNY